MDHREPLTKGRASDDNGGIISYENACDRVGGELFGHEWDIMASDESALAVQSKEGKGRAGLTWRDSRAINPITFDLGAAAMFHQERAIGPPTRRNRGRRRGLATC